MSSESRDDFYVYALAHPAFGLFYIGKGRGSRVTTHEIDLIAAESVDSEKNGILKAIRDRGSVPTRYLIASDLSEVDAYRIEAVLIAFSSELQRSDLAPLLSNRARGHGAAVLMLRDSQIDMMNTGSADLGDRRIVLLSINREFNPFVDYKAEIPDHVAGRWVLSQQKAQVCEYVVACTHRRIVGVYKDADWKPKPEKGDKRPRYWFTGKVADDEFAKSIRYRLLPDNIRFGSGNPVAYFPQK